MNKLCVSLLAMSLSIAGSAEEIPSNTAIDAEVHKIMTRTHGTGLAVAVIDHGTEKRAYPTAGNMGTEPESHEC